YVQANSTGEETSAVAPTRTAATAPKTTKGGTITRTSVVTDTGARKPMFGLTARHIKTSMSMKASPDACDKTNMSIETDGWYVDLPLFSCPVPMPRNPYSRGAKAGCQDTVIGKASGGSKIGFPLEMTQT